MPTMLLFVLLTPLQPPFFYDPKDEIVIYEAHTECELRDFGTIMECTSYELHSNKVYYTVCTIDEHGTQCIDYE